MDIDNPESAESSVSVSPPVEIIGAHATDAAAAAGEEEVHSPLTRSLTPPGLVSDASLEVMTDFERARLRRSSSPGNLLDYSFPDQDEVSPGGRRKSILRRCVCLRVPVSVG